MSRETPYRNMHDVRQYNRETGGHFFDAGAMRFFSSRILSGFWPLADGTALFITSERDRSSGQPRRYTVRRAMLDGSIERVGGFQAYESARAARGAASALQRERVFGGESE